MLENIRKLTGIYGPSGYEGLVGEYIQGIISGFADKAFLDDTGNLVAFKKGRSSARKIMFTAHMDQVGLMITGACSDGFLRFSKYGELNMEQLTGSEVMFRNGMTGIVASEGNRENVQNNAMEKMFIDIGCRSGEQARELVHAGDICVFAGKASCMNDAVSGSALDNRVGCHILMEAIQKSGTLRFDTFFVFTIQNVLGARGARNAAIRLEPDEAISIDAAAAQDIPGAKSVVVRLGHGPVIKLRDSSHVCHAVVNELLISVAENKSLPFQFDATPTGLSDSASVHTVKDGIPTGIIAVPTRYLHSRHEVCSMEDIKATIELVKAVIAG